MGAKNDECRKCETPKPSEGLVQKNSRSQVKPGDWICPSCGDHQFARNDECKQCSAAKPDGVVVAKAEMKPGDWICPACEDDQFASKVKCSQCGEKRPAGTEKKPTVAGKAGGKAAKKATRAKPY